MKSAIPVITKIAIIQCYPATGYPFKTVEYLFRNPENKLSKLSPEMHQAIARVPKSLIGESKNQFTTN